MTPIVNYYTDFVVGLIKQMHPTNILEIGVGSDAYSAQRIIKTIEEFQDNKPFYYGIESNDGIEYSILKTISKNWKIVFGSSQDLSSYAEIPECDLVLIDGNHSADGVFVDTHASLQKLSKDGIFVYHDSVSVLIKEAFVRLRERFNLEIFELDVINVAIGRRKT